VQIIVEKLKDVDPWLSRVRAAANRTAQALARVSASEPDGLELLRRMKFTEMAWHPLDDRRSLNLVEQINQTWTCLVSLKSLRFLFDRHPDAGGFRLNLGAEPGTDIVSLCPDVVAAETFAAVHPTNNRKLAKDLAKLNRECPSATARYVFFGAPGFAHERYHKFETLAGIEVWGIDV
jgi:hypothetical protein